MFDLDAYHSYDGYMRQFQINFFGHLNVTNAFLPHMRGRTYGTIVFIGSRSSYRSHVPVSTENYMTTVLDCTNCWHR